jgi:hypothetical protein
VGASGWSSGVPPDRLPVLADLAGLEARDEVQDRAAGLVRDDGAGRERAAVADAFHFVEHRLGLGAGPHEVGVQRMHAVGRVDREPGRA